MPRPFTSNPASHPATRPINRNQSKDHTVCFSGLRDCSPLDSLHPFLPGNTAFYLGPGASWSSRNPPIRSDASLGDIDRDEPQFQCGRVGPEAIIACRGILEERVGELRMLVVARALPVDECMARRPVFAARSGLHPERPRPAPEHVEIRFHQRRRLPVRKRVARTIWCVRLDDIMSKAIAPSGGLSPSNGAGA